MQRKLELQREALAERERQAQGRTSVRATLDDGASNRPAANTPVARGSQSSKSGEDDGGEKSLWEKFVSFFESIFSPEETPEPASSTPKVVTMVTVPPTASPKPTPTPTPSPTPSPTPGTEERDRMASEGVAFAIGELGEPYSSSGRYGDKGYDCSGLVIAMCEAMHSDLPFGAGIKSTCQYGMAESFLNNDDYGTKIYSYKEDNSINELQPGDLVFYAKPDNLKKDVHVAIATGEMIYDPETGASWPEVIEASSVSKSVTKQYPAYNIQDGGQYSRSHSRQVITYVIRPNFAWEEQP